MLIRLRRSRPKNRLRNLFRKSHSYGVFSVSALDAVLICRGNLLRKTHLYRDGPQFRAEIVSERYSMRYDGDAMYKDSCSFEGKP